jgi:hypothetical protein
MHAALDKGGKFISFDSIKGVQLSLCEISRMGVDSFLHLCLRHCVYVYVLFSNSYVFPYQRLPK